MQRFQELTAPFHSLMSVVKHLHGVKKTSKEDLELVQKCAQTLSVIYRAPGQWTFSDSQRLEGVKLLRYE